MSDGEGLLESLHRLNDALDKANSAFPATREFLDRLGLTCVGQLTPQQMTGLKAHLEAKLEEAGAPLN